MIHNEGLRQHVVGSTMKAEDFRLLIERGDTDGLHHALKADPGLASKTIHWTLKQANQSDPLHSGLA